MFVVRTEGGGVYRVNAALISQTQTNAVPRRKFLRTFGPLFPGSSPPLSCPSFSSPINKIVPTAERKLLAACSDALSVTVEERALCVVGQINVFIPLGMHAKLKGLVTILSRSKNSFHHFCISMLCSMEELSQAYTKYHAASSALAWSQGSSAACKTTHSPRIQDMDRCDAYTSIVAPCASADSLLWRTDYCKT